MLTMHQVMALLGHTGRAISYLKVDVEGSEWQVFSGAHGVWTHCRNGTAAGPRIDVDHLNIELHGAGGDRSGRPIIKWFRDAAACGLRIFHKEINERVVRGTFFPTHRYSPPPLSRVWWEYMSGALIEYSMVRV